MSGLEVVDVDFRLAPLRAEDVVFKVNRRARRYVARVGAAGMIALTIPHGGNRRDALAFANTHRAWLEEQKAKARVALAAEQSRRLTYGSAIRFRGRLHRLKSGAYWGRPYVTVGEHRIFLADEGMDLARPLADYFRGLAKEELTTLVFELAERFKLRVSKVVIRDQKTRWGSCSTSKVISLNWRLLLAPIEARDYVIIHELMHLKRFDHSPAFWRLVEQACPDFRKHEAWLIKHQEELRW